MKATFEEFKKYMYLYKSQVDLENTLKNMGIDLNPDKGIQLHMDECISFIPDLLFDDSDLFWNNLNYDSFDNFEDFELYIDELWDEINSNKK